MAAITLLKLQGIATSRVSNPKKQFGVSSDIVYQSYVGFIHCNCLQSFEIGDFLTLKRGQNFMKCSAPLSYNNNNNINEISFYGPEFASILEESNNYFPSSISTIKDSISYTWLGPARNTVKLLHSLRNQTRFAYLKIPVSRLLWRMPLQHQRIKPITDAGSILLILFELEQLLLCDAFFIIINQITG